MKKYIRILKPLIVVVFIFACALVMWPIVAQQSQRLEKIQAATATQQARKQMVDSYRATEVAKINPEAHEADEANLDGIILFLSNTPPLLIGFGLAAIIGLLAFRGGTIKR